jgi:ribosomal protein S18 acetylase RimI-like enzyme
MSPEIIRSISLSRAWWLIGSQESSMTAHASVADITFTENSPVDVARLNALYQVIG